LRGVIRRIFLLQLPASWESVKAKQPKSEDFRFAGSEGASAGSNTKSVKLNELVPLIIWVFYTQHVTLNLELKHTQ